MAVAVVGMACRYPKAVDVRQYWANLRAGVEGISRFTRDDAIARGARPDVARRPEFVPAKGFLTDSGTFDWAFFGYSRAEAAGIDPQQRVFLECASAAVDDAGIDPTRFPGWIGLYAGADVVGAAPDLGASELAQVIGREKDFLATRVAYKLGFRGPAVTVQTACSTSLTATHMAVRSLLGNECDVALAGGVTVTAAGEWGYLYEAGGILSPDGHCRPFDEHAGGTVPSEGVGVVVLKRLEDALRDGDRIAAVILGSALNNDGSDKMGYTAPSITGQSEVIGYAQQIAGIDPADIDYVEAHGTATRMGDPVEVSALTDVFRTSTDATGWCLLGAVKSNLGHTGAAAGVAGLIKTVLMVEHREVVPTLHYNAPNPLLDIESTPFRVCAEAGPWPSRGVRLAAVSSFGVGGTNAHVIVEAAPQRDRPRGSGKRLIPLSAASADALSRLRGDLAEQLSTDPSHALSEVSRTLTGRRTHRHRQVIVADDVAQAAILLRGTASATVPAAAPRTLGEVAFLLPGQGTLRDAAGAVPYRLLPVFKKAFDEIADAVTIDLSPVVTAGTAPEWFANTVHQQLGLFALGYALGRQLGEWGVQASAMFGNSVGEYAAAALAGVWAPGAAANLVYERATAMWDTEPGLMATIDSADVPLPPGISVAVAGPGRTVLSGPVTAMEELLATGIDARRLATLRAFHSPLMRPAAEAVAAALAATPAHTTRIRLVANESGDWADPEAMLSPGYWTGQMLRTVRLADGAGTLLAAGYESFIELGPGASMISTLRRHPAWSPENTVVPLLGTTDDPERDLLRAVGVLWEHGVDLALADVATDTESLRCSLPSHPFAATDPVAAPVAARPAVTVARPQGTLADLWCRTLGVATVSESDNFFALGGESLMIVSLLRQVRDLTGRDVPVIEFTADATFGALTRLAGTDQVAAAGQPLFLIADAMGTALGYRELARLADRPVHCLEPARPADRIESLAAQHVERILETQPDGPYTLGGWSFGAIVAHEVAAQLLRRGARVDMLVCLDGYVPATGRPIGLDPRYLTSSVRLRTGARFGFGPIGRRVRRTPDVRRQFVVNMDALLRYRPEPVDCPVVLFKAGADTRALAALRTRLTRIYRDPVRIHPVPGDHWSMLTSPHVHSLATRLRGSLPAPVHSGDS
ncbi:type I polyketide synthase [Kibdelosporangium phytohabitans]|uniref:Beta-ketoacyl synthase n=1 Tax=Kibdelosporangium phytohabitans TaxID=860235 RepID=A0A0N9HZ41_9PSEU|nr:type I polyketide synthase [Kibdelosporangium phytohabitans]ALG10938.1 beta-ketoacyl synthase [Kibdelosporangium phytohabitans]MBE1462138.1 phthiocerol/phenolphthiocerol synthesis type-I polyketide synthase E [Kibdelosporangium phytohabitans]